MDKNRNTLQYFAGFFDADGHVCITKSKHNGHVLKIGVTNTNLEIIEIFKDRFNGHIKRYVPKNSNWKVRYDWVATSKFAVEALKKLYPFLGIKKDRAKIALKFSELITKSKRVDSDNLKAREKFYLEMKSLNKRGL